MRRAFILSVGLTASLGGLATAQGTSETIPARPMETTPNIRSSPEHERYEADMQRQLEQWQGRIDQARAQASSASRHSAVEGARQSFLKAKQNWEKLRQAKNPDNWDTARTHLEAAMAELRQSWSEVAEASPK